MPGMACIFLGNFRYMRFLDPSYIVWNSSENVRGDLKWMKNS